MGWPTSAAVGWPLSADSADMEKFVADSMKMLPEIRRAGVCRKCSRQLFHVPPSQKKYAPERHRVYGNWRWTSVCEADSRLDAPHCSLTELDAAAELNNLLCELEEMHVGEDA